MGSLSDAVSAYLWSTAHNENENEARGRLHRVVAQYECMAEERLTLHGPPYPSAPAFWTREELETKREEWLRFALDHVQTASVLIDGKIACLGDLINALKADDGPARRAG